VSRGETGVGKWTLVVRDTKENEHNGTFVDWHLKLWGESIDADKTTLLPMPNADDDADQAVEQVGRLEHDAEAVEHRGEIHGVS